MQKFLKKMNDHLRQMPAVKVAKVLEKGISSLIFSELYMTHRDSNNHPKISVLDRLGFAFVGFIFGIILGILPSSYRFLHDGPQWFSWPMAIVIALLTPGIFAIVAVCNADRLVRLFRSKFWRRALRVGLGIIGVVFLLIGVILLFVGFPGWLLSLIFLSLGIGMLWAVFRGTDKDISQWWEDCG